MEKTDRLYYRYNDSQTSPQISKKGIKPSVPDLHLQTNMQYNSTHSGNKDEKAFLNMRYKPECDKLFLNTHHRKSIKRSWEQEWEQVTRRCPHLHWRRENFLGNTYFTCERCGNRRRLAAPPMRFKMSKEEAEKWFEECFPSFSSPSLKSHTSKDGPHRNEWLIKKQQKILEREQHPAVVAKALRAEDMMQSEAYQRMTSQLHAALSRVNSDVQTLARRYTTALKVFESRLTRRTNEENEKRLQEERQMKSQEVNQSKRNQRESPIIKQRKKHQEIKQNEHQRVSQRIKQKKEHQETNQTKYQRKSKQINRTEEYQRKSQKISPHGEQQKKSQEINENEEQRGTLASAARLEVRDMVLGGYFYACVTLQHTIFLDCKVFCRLNLVYHRLRDMFPNLPRDFPVFKYLEALIPMLFPRLSSNHRFALQKLALRWIYTVANLKPKISKRSLISCCLIAVSIEINHKISDENIRFLINFDCNYKKWKDVITIFGKSFSTFAQQSKQTHQLEIEKLLDDNEDDQEVAQQNEETVECHSDNDSCRPNGKRKYRRGRSEHLKLKKRKRV